MAVVLLAVGFYNLSPLNHNAKARASTLVLVLFSLPVLVPWAVWRLSGTNGNRQRIGKLHGGQMAMLSAGAVLIAGLFVAEYRGGDKIDDFASIALVIALVAAAIIIPWRWFDTRK